MKVSDSQSMILPTASRRDDRALYLPEEPKHEQALSGRSAKRKVARAARAKTATKVRKRSGAAKVKAKTTKKAAGKEKPGSKQDSVIALLRRPGGASLEALGKATGWQPDSLRGFLAGTVRKKLKLPLQSEKVEGTRTYRIGPAKPAKPAGAR